MLTSLKGTKFRNSVQITLLRLNSLISGPDDNQRQTDGRFTNVIGRKCIFKYRICVKSLLFSQVILMIMLECWHLSSEYNFVASHTHVEKDQKVLAHQWKVAPSLISKIIVEMELENHNHKYTVIKSQRIHLKESKVLNIACF